MPNTKGLRVRNLHTIALAIPIKKATTIWGKQSILAEWMQLKYVKGRDIRTITIRPTIDSVQWKEIMGFKTLSHNT